ncbi:MAG: thioredoxin domain-containing protein [Actinomycetota bacterium]
MSNAAPNRLADETSPYLLQHAHNPVDWYPWGSEALERAKTEDKPILISVGYAACHWCHVMEKESFEDEETAAFMNEHFVSIKVDREERPDIDSIYMDAVQAMTGSGGWPMTVFATPEGEPFYAGTYFPKQDSHGMPAFRRVLEAIAELWREKRDEVTEQAGKVIQGIEAATGLSESKDELTEDILRSAHSALKQNFDAEWGGFGGAPKFPQPMTLEFLLRCHLRAYEFSLDMARRTLDKMAGGGIYDQVGGGFHRYSVDRYWLVPHFEKMLYDNAQLARLYTHGWQVTGDDRHRRIAVETIEYMLREMRHPQGGFYSSQDADSEGEEGKFFTWSWDDLVRVAGRNAAAFFGATPEGNWDGTNVLWTPLALEAAAEKLRVHPSDLTREVEQARGALFEEREKRVRPATDDKILASWNGLAIAALAEAGRILGEERYLEAAGQAADFVLDHLRGANGRLIRSWRDGRPGGQAYSDDYALMSDACLILYEATGEPRYFRESRSLDEDLVKLFRDEERGGFFLTGSDGEPLVVRPKDLFDNAMPSGNSAAAMALQRLALLIGDAELESAGVSALRLVREPMANAPTGFGYALCALDLYLGPAREIAIVGAPGYGEIEQLVSEVWGRFMPNRVLAVAPPEVAGGAAEVKLLKDRPMVDGKATAYVCERFVCKRPVTDPQELARQLEA